MVAERRAHLGKNGWWIHKGQDEATFTRRQPGGWTERHEVSRTIWDSHFTHPKIAPVPTAEIGPEKTTLLDTVQKIHRRHPWQVRRDAIDNGVIDSIANELERRGFEEKAARMRLCGVTRGQRQCRECAHHQTPEVYHCNEYHLCPRCARIRSKKIRHEIEFAMRNVRQVSGYRWRFITLSISTEGRYKEATKAVVKSFGKIYQDILRYRWYRLEDADLGRLRQRGDKHYLGRQRVFPGRDGVFHRRERIVGDACFRALEYGGLNGNCHLHALYYGPYIPRDILSAEWERLTGSWYADIRPVRSKPQSDGEKSFGDAIKEVCKYVTKISDIPPERVVDFWQAMRGSHMTQRYGQLRGLMRSEAELFDLSCEKCGSTRYIWHYLPWEVALSERRRGPPREPLLGEG